MKAEWQGNVIAQAPQEELIYIEGNWYFPPARINGDFLQTSDTPYVCPWKGQCQYFDVGREDSFSSDSAWSYPEPKASAIDQVKKDFSNYVAFWRDVSVSRV